MLLGINAGFGEPIGHEFAALTDLGFSFVRQDFRPHHTDAHVRALVGEFAGAPVRLLALLAGGHIDKPGGGRAEPHEIAELGARVVTAARDLGVTDYLIEVGNEPDLAHVDYRLRPMDFADAVRQTHAAVRSRGFAGPLITGGICNLSRDSLRYLERMLVAGVPADMALGFHRYPRGLSPRVPQAGFDSRDAEWAELQRLASGRAVACTEVGHHTAPRKYLMWGFIPRHRTVGDGEVAEHLLYDLRYFEERRCLLAAVYQLNDGPSPAVHLDRYGIRRVDGTLKPVALAIRSALAQRPAG